MKKAIGILTSGGDAPGMNAAVRAATRTAISLGYDVIGINHGYNGLVDKDIEHLDARSVSNTIQHGGTILYTARCKEFTTLEGQEKAIKNAKKMGLEGIIVMGGDGTFRGASALSQGGIPTIALPATIDNDIACTDYTIGFDTAMNTAIEMIDKLRDTAQSHDKCSVVEVMGRNCGALALNVGLAVGAIGILVPEIPYDLEYIAHKIKKLSMDRKQHSIVVVAEGCGDSREIAKNLAELTGIETRDTVLGHVQRGGSPTLRDRNIASQMGYYAVSLLNSGASNRVIGWKNDHIVDVDIYEALKMKKEFDDNLYKIANEISF